MQSTLNIKGRIKALPSCFLKCFHIGVTVSEIAAWKWYFGGFHNLQKAVENCDEGSCINDTFCTEVQNLARTREGYYAAWANLIFYVISICWSWHWRNFPSCPFYVQYEGFRFGGRNIKAPVRYLSESRSFLKKFVKSILWRAVRRHKISSCLTVFFWISLPLQRSLLPDQDNDIKILKPSDRWTYKILPLFVPEWLWALLQEVKQDT
jgi:hypothetical protein